MAAENKSGELAERLKGRNAILGRLPFEGGQEEGGKHCPHLDRVGLTIDGTAEVG
jgi:hypothetical protein